MIHVKGIIKDYPGVRALDNVSFSVKEGAFFALLGPNGAGKTTTIEIISTLKGVDFGEVSVNGAVVGRDDDAVRKAIGVVFQYSTLDEKLTVKENLQLRGSFYDLEKSVLAERIERLQEAVGFSSYRDRRVGELSGGQRRKADIARALLNHPRILLLDEPTTGLDPQSREEIWELVMRLKQKTNMTIVLTTHYMEEVRDCDHVIILNKGRICAEDSAERLRIRYAKDRLRLTPKSSRLEERLSEADIAHQKVQSTIHVPIRDPFGGIEIVRRFEADIDTFEIVKGTMDDVFLAVTGRKMSDAHESAR